MSFLLSSYSVLSLPIEAVVERHRRDCLFLVFLLYTDICLPPFPARPQRERGDGLKWCAGTRLQVWDTTWFTSSGSASVVPRGVTVVLHRDYRLPGIPHDNLSFFLSFSSHLPFDKGVKCSCHESGSIVVLLPEHSDSGNSRPQLKPTSSGKVTPESFIWSHLM